MIPINLYDYQEDAVKRLKTGAILCGGVGSGKSRTALAYYYIRNGGNIHTKCDMKHSPKDLYIITTARKRDTCEWEGECTFFLLSTDPKLNHYANRVHIDSWNNIQKYKHVEDAFFIFDEQRVVGYGKWSKAFIQIARHNEWILLSATPGDKWTDYIPVFIANGFYKNKTEFEREHIIWSHYTNFPKIDRIINTGRLIKERRDILITMDYHNKNEQHHEDIMVHYNQSAYQDVVKNRKNPETHLPIQNASEYCQVLRKLVNTDISRQIALLEILEDHPKAIVFYNYDYELDILRNMVYPSGTVIAEWNGHRHDILPDSDCWVYLVQYTAGSEGWNCTTTDTIIFYSANYSYRTMVQAAGRIDRNNTPFNDLYYYHLRSRSGIDLAIHNAVSTKKKFNEGAFYGRVLKQDIRNAA